MIKRMSKVLGFVTAVCILVGAAILPAYAGGGLPDGVQTFSGYTFASGVATSPDGFFKLKAYLGDSTTPTTLLQADEFGAFIGNTPAEGAETAYFEITASSALGSFRLHFSSIGEWGVADPNFSNVTVKGYVSGAEVFSTVPYTGTLNTYQTEYPIDFTAVQDIPIDSFRVYYTKEEGTNHPNFNLVSFTIGEASTQPPEPPALTYGISLSPAADYTFPAATAGYGAQDARTVTVSNTGTGATGQLAVALGGTNPDAFTLSQSSISSIAPSGSGSFDIAPKTGLAAGDYSAAVTVTGGNSITPQSMNVSFKVNPAMSEDTLEKQVDSATITAKGLFAQGAQLIVVPMEDGDADREELEEQLSKQNAIAAFEVHVEPAQAFQPPLTLTFKVGEMYNGRTVYILHKLSNGSTDIFTPMVANGEAEITVNELSPFLLAVDPQVTIVQQPQSALALAGQTAVFHVKANGLDVTYQWQRRTGANAAWEDIAGATGPDYTTSTLNRSHDGYQYRVTVTDVLGNSVTSDTATLSVNTLPATGDTAQPLAYGFMAVLFAAAALLLLKKRRAA